MIERVKTSCSVQTNPTYRREFSQPWIILRINHQWGVVFRPHLESEPETRPDHAESPAEVSEGRIRHLFLPRGGASKTKTEGIVGECSNDRMTNLVYLNSFEQAQPRTDPSWNPIDGDPLSNLTHDKRCVASIRIRRSQPGRRSEPESRRIQHRDYDRLGQWRLEGLGDRRVDRQQQE